MEIFDPSKPADQAYVRFGTDAARMVDPTPVDDLGAVVHAWSITGGARLTRSGLPVVRPPRGQLSGRNAGSLVDNWVFASNH